MQVKSLVQLDHYASEYFLKLDNKIVTHFLFPFSSLFHPKMILIPILCIYFLSGSVLDAGYYALCMVVTVIISTILKRNLKRPTLRGHVKKFQHFRKKESNFSIPSGDTVQAVLFSIFLHQVYGVNWLIALFITIFVAISRVYFMCHWLGDTIFAMIIETPIALVLISLRQPIIQFTKNILKQSQYSQYFMPFISN